VNDDGDAYENDDRAMPRQVAVTAGRVATSLLTMTMKMNDVDADDGGG